jgi:hypothetical protein
VLWWTGGDYQTWKACNALGMFIGNLYIYTGNR